jgi:hypothetical protein
MSEIKEFGRRIINTFRKNIIDYFESFKGGVNVLYQDFLDSVIIQPAQTRVFTIGLPIEKGKKIDFMLTEIESAIPTLAIINLKDFPIEQVMVRLEFPSVIYGAKGQFPKIVFSAQLRTPWPGEFGLAWLPITGSEQFVFHPYEDKTKRAENLAHFYDEGLLDPLCDFLNTSEHKLAVKLRENIKAFLESDENVILNYPNPFQKKKVYNTIDVPIYCEFFDENEASILYFECFIIKGVKGLKETWIPPADIIVNILQYIGLSTELFDFDGNLLPEADLQKAESTLDDIEVKVKQHEKEKKSAELKEEWDPCTTKNKVRRDVLGYSMSDGTVIKEEHSSVLDKVAKMKALMQQKQAIEEETPVPPPLVTTEPKPEPIDKKTISKELLTKFRSEKSGPTPEPSPQKTIIKETAPRKRRGRTEPTSPTTATEPDTMDLWKKSPTTPSTQAEKPKEAVSEPDTMSLWKKGTTLSTPSPAAAPAPKPTPTPTPPKVEKKAPAPRAIFASAKDWFNKFQMRQFVCVGQGSELPFKDKANYRIIQTLPKPFMLMFARDKLKIQKNALTAEVIDALFALYKTGNIKAL